MAAIEGAPAIKWRCPDWATCRPEDVLHGSGHLAVTQWLPASERRLSLVGWLCLGCGKASKTWTPVRR